MSRKLLVGFAVVVALALGSPQTAHATPAAGGPNCGALARTLERLATTLGKGHPALQSFLERVYNPQCSEKDPPPKDPLPPLEDKNP